MTELRDFLTALYDSFSEAEMQTLQHGQRRLAELLNSGTVPQDVSLPVYHATDVEVTLQVGLEIEETEEGLSVSVVESPSDRASQFVFTVELYEFLEQGDLEEIEYDDVLPPGAVPDVGGEEGGGDQGREEQEKTKDEAETREEERRNERTGKTVRTVDIVSGIDPTHTALLKERGVGTLSKLVEHSPEELAELASGDDSEVSAERAEEWIEQAQGLAAILDNYEGELPVELVDGIGPTFGGRLREHGIEELGQLVDLSPAEVAEITSTESASVSPDRADDWLEEAREHLRMVDEFDGETEEEGNGEPRDSTDADEPTDTESASETESDSETESSIDSTEDAQ